MFVLARKCPPNAGKRGSSAPVLPSWACDAEIRQLLDYHLGAPLARPLRRRFRTMPPRINASVDTAGMPAAPARVEDLALSKETRAALDRFAEYPMLGSAATSQSTVAVARSSAPRRRALPAEGIELGFFSSNVGLGVHTIDRRERDRRRNAGQAKRERERRRGACFSCGKRGHRACDCPTKANRQRMGGGRPAISVSERAQRARVRAQHRCAHRLVAKARA